MKLTPGQIADLQSPANVRGAILVGNDATPLFRVAIAYHTFERAQVLTAATSLPIGLVWYVSVANPDRVELHTTHPEWFVELEEQINASRRPNRP